MPLAMALSGDGATLYVASHRSGQPDRGPTYEADPVEDEHDLAIIDLAARARTGTILGSPSYMSPEQVAGSKVDGRSDLFSLGTTLYQLLSGSLPFRGDSVANVMYQIANAKTPPLRKARQGLPASVTRLVMRALQKDPGKRFVSGADMATAIRKCRAQLRGGRRKTA